MNQCERDHLAKMVTRIALLIMVMTILINASGCSWIESDAGKARYTYTVTLADGTEHMIDLKNAKDIGLISAKVTRLDDGTVEVELIEQGVNASSPMAVMAEQNAKMLEAVLPLLNRVP